MSRHNVVSRVIAMLLVSLLGLTGCATPAITPPPSPQPAIPTKPPPTETEVAKDTPAPEPTQAPGPTLVAFKGPDGIDAPQPLTGLIYVSVGTYSNELSQTFVITVTGRLTDAVQAYTSSAKFHLLATAPQSPTKAAEVIVGSGKSLFEVAFSDATTENLIIDMDLAPADAEKFQDGYDLSLEVDPTVSKGYTHHYRAQHVTPSLTTKMSVSFGNVTANLYKNCLSTGATPIATTSGVVPLPSSASGYAWYDLAVTGTGSGNTYSIVQGLWNNYSYHTTSTSPTSGVTCWATYP